MASFGPDSVVLPTGNTSNRPGSPSVGLMRYNTDEASLEFYSSGGWKVSKAPLGSFENPGTSGTAIYNAGQTTSGVYWLKKPDGTKFQAYIKMDYGGGWINLNTNLGPYTNVLTSGYGSGGSNILTGANGNGLDVLNCGTSTHNQAGTYGCGGSSGQSYVNLDTTFKSNFSITQVRIKIYVSYSSNVICGPYWTNAVNGGYTIITGTSMQVSGTCNNPPNDWTSLTGSGFTVEYYGTMNGASTILYAWTACGGTFDMQLKEVYVR